jgi:GTP cyclohydrolase II
VKTIERVAAARLPTEYGEFRVIGYRSPTSDEEFAALGRFGRSECRVLRLSRAPPEPTTTAPASNYLRAKKEMMGRLLQVV